MHAGFYHSSYTELQYTRVAMAHREADGCEYHPVSRLAGMRVCGQVGESAYSKIAYSAEGERGIILRLPCRAALQDGRAGGISMSLDFFGTFWVKPKSTDRSHEHYPQFKIINMNGRLYDPTIPFSGDVIAPDYSNRFYLFNQK